MTMRYGSIIMIVHKRLAMQLSAGSLDHWFVVTTNSSATSRGSISCSLVNQGTSNICWQISWEIRYLSTSTQSVRPQALCSRVFPWHCVCVFANYNRWVPFPQKYCIIHHSRAKIEPTDLMTPYHMNSGTLWAMGATVGGGHFYTLFFMNLLLNLYHLQSLWWYQGSF